jgi:hypothetical protein
MSQHFLIEFATKDDDVFESTRRQAIIRPAVVPDLRLAEKTEPSPMDNLGSRRHRIRAEEHCGAENPFECRNQSAILLAALAHAEGPQHLGGCSEANRLTFLLNGQRREKNGDNSVFAEGHSVMWVADDLKNEFAVPPFVDELTGRERSEWQAAENERARAKTESLIASLTAEPNEFDAIKLRCALL